MRNFVRLVKNDEFVQECLRIHNHYRADHGSPCLHLSTEVSAFSQKWADRLAKEDHFHHSNHPKYGENLFVSYMSDNSLPMATAKEVVESWYAEQKFYPFGCHITRDIIYKAGHFTQVIWRNSRELGIGRSISRTNRVYVVANYFPAGNVFNKFEDNVRERLHQKFLSPQTFLQPQISYTRRLSSRRMNLSAFHTERII
ncbi:hypothetical protein JTE90_002167 [Oedothorax gibbosus]|uniref:SCP domain-containing protein n=1 Tax=Oedothorax gibbosus TaxID=931172 RepID=A0AAV6V7Y7_9ARAC|nr:hypothetical protein JTE90_002167 [Oedothorax gibbosus]